MARAHNTNISRNNGRVLCIAWPNTGRAIHSLGVVLACGLEAYRVLLTQRLRPTLKSNPEFTAGLIQTGRKPQFDSALCVLSCSRCPENKSGWREHLFAQHMHSKATVCVAHLRSRSPRVLCTRSCMRDGSSRHKPATLCSLFTYSTAFLIRLVKLSSLSSQTRR